MKRIRIAWKIRDEEGHGLPFPPEKQKLLEAWCAEGNKNYGPYTHWIEEIEA